jgi:hypothetical protein
VRGGGEAGLQVDHPLAGQELPGAGVHDRPAAQREYPPVAGDRARHRLAFQPPEDGLAVGDEDVADGLARRLLDHVVGVQELRLQQAGEQPPHGGLARPGRADQDRHRPAHAITSESR